MEVQRDQFAVSQPIGNSMPSLTIAAAFLILAAMVLCIPSLVLPYETCIALLLLVMPLGWWIRRKLRSEFDWFELFPIVGILGFLYFGVGALWLKSNPRELFSASLAPYLTSALNVGLVGMACAFFGYLIRPSGFRRSSLGRYEPRGSGFHVLLLSVGFAGEIGMVLQSRIVNLQRTALSPAISALQQFAPLFLIAWSLLWIEFWANRLTRASRLVLFGLAFPMVAVVLAGLFGGKEVAIVLISYPAVTFAYVRRRLPWKVLVVVLLIGVFVIFPLYNTYRNTHWDESAGRRLDETVQQVSRWDRSEFVAHSVTAFMNRFALVYCVAAILRDVPRAVPYQYGSTLVLAPIGMFVPRFIWPDKPMIMIGRQFGETFQLVNPLDETTQISPTFPGEFYWNFDLPGVVLGMLLFGVAMRWFYERYGGGSDFAPLRRACYLGLLPPAIHFEGNVAGMVGIVGKSLVIMAFFVFVARRFGMLKTLGDEAGGVQIPG